MARKKKGRSVSGWLILDKPLEMGSTQAVNKVKWLFQAKKAGHAGTLDPLATGLLPIALGEATKTVNYVMDGIKTYHFTVSWGSQTTTDDLEGDVVKTSNKRPTRSDIESVLPDFTGMIEQIPPSYSAIKVDGERAYTLSREGVKVDLKAREVFIDRLEIVKIDKDICVFEADCSKGTYVRSLARDIGEKLGCYGHISSLRRIAVGQFKENNLVTLNDLVEMEGDFDALDDQLLNITQALGELPEIGVSERDAARIRAGNSVLLRGKDAPLIVDDAFATHHGEVLALGSVEAGSFQPRKVFVF